MEFKKRSNKKQISLMVERLHANYLLVRGNQEEAAAVTMWAELAQELNRLGCRRTIEQWQHVWDTWVGKIKLKARKLRDHMEGTGGGEAIPGLTELEEKVIYIVGSASVHGFASNEVGTTAAASASPPEPASPAPSTSASTSLPHTAASAQPQPLPSQRRGQRTRLRGRVRPSQPRPRPPVNDNLVRSLTETSALLRETIRDSTRQLAAALTSVGEATIQAAHILAAALSGSVTVMEDSTTVEDSTRYCYRRLKVAASLK